MKVQRFKAALVTGTWGDSNPEDLRRDQKGDYVLYKDYEAVVSLLNRVFHESCYDVMKKEHDDMGVLAYCEALEFLKGHGAIDEK